MNKILRSRGTPPITTHISRLRRLTYIEVIFRLCLGPDSYVQLAEAIRIVGYEGGTDEWC